MNPITATEKIKRLQLRNPAVKDTEKLPLLTLPKGWFSAQWGDMHKNRVLLLHDDGGVVLPCEGFRFSLPACEPSKEDPEPFTECNGIVIREGEVISLQYIFSFKSDGRTPFAPCKDIHVILILHSNGAMNVIIKMNSGKGWHTLNDGSGPIKKNEMFMIMPLIMIISYYTSGLFQPITAAPPREKQVGKSAEWVRARTYYTVVHRRHAANSKGVERGAMVADNSCVKTAHSRRAHFRVLRSEKWGASMGKRIMVRACWVGPKEWIDSESKQVYTIA